MKIRSYMVLAISLMLLLVAANGVFAQDEKMKMDEYQAQLAEAQNEEATTSQDVEALDAEIVEIDAKIVTTQEEIDATWAEIYAMLGTDKAGYEAYGAELASIDSKIDGLAALTPEELFKAKDEVKALEEEIAAAKEQNLASLSENEAKLAELEARIASLKANMPANIFDQYTVVDGDYLWKIAKKDDIYGNAYQWIRIYSVNKDQIKDPDLIYSDQVFNIARGVGMDEHLVSKGDHLSKIAGCAKVFNDPTKWTKIYEANKDLVSDPSLIYPYQVLKIPAE